MDGGGGGEEGTWFKNDTDSETNHGVFLLGARTGEEGKRPKGPMPTFEEQEEPPLQASPAFIQRGGSLHGSFFFLFAHFGQRGNAKGEQVYRIHPPSIHPPVCVLVAVSTLVNCFCRGDATEGNERVVIPGLGLSRERTSLLKCLSRMLVTCDPQSQTQLPATTPLPNRTQTSRHQTHYSLIHIYTIHNPKTKV